ncbi:MAG: alpha/beta hydrolase [Pararhodobacter sp.]|nr:alpha/beta hydrolase [Pararhodobacter sp.]
MRMVETNGVQLATESFGSANDPAILLIMGAATSMLGWPERFCENLAGRGFFVVRFDHRDTGQSTTLPPGQANYFAEDLAADVVGILNAYRLEQVALMGMSLGGYIAQMIALEHPERVRSLILLASEPLGWDGPSLPHIPEEFFEHFGTLESLDWSDRGEVIRFLERIAEMSSGSGQNLDGEQVRTRIEQVLARTGSPASMFNHASMTAREDWTGRFREIVHPVLVIHGEDDPLLPVENGQAIAAGIDGAEIHVVSGMGHELPNSRLATIADLVAGHSRQLVE